MEFSVKPAPIKSILKPWLFATAIFFPALLILGLMAYAIWGHTQGSLAEVVFIRWSFSWVYAPIFALGIAFQGRPNIIRVKHSQPLNLPEAISMLSELKWAVESQTPQGVVFRNTNRFERLFMFNQKVCIDLSNGETVITAPARLVYHIHHGLKFGKLLTQN